MPMCRAAMMSSIVTTPATSVRRHERSDYRATVAQQVDHLVQVLDLQPVIERVAEARPSETARACRGR